MGQLPNERLEVVSPFEATALDLFGPFWVKDAAKGRRRFKCWVVAYVCMGAKAVVLLPCPGYSTDDFLTTHRFFTGIFGEAEDNLHRPRPLAHKGCRDTGLGRPSVTRLEDKAQNGG